MTPNIENIEVLVTGETEGITEQEVIDALYNVIESERKDATWKPGKPASDATLWRYINFTQLVSLIESGGLWFSKIDQFEDPYETAYPKPTVDYIIDEMWEYLDSDTDALTLRASHAIQDYLRGFNSCRVNCWALKEHQSAALWKQYLDADEGVAIKTSVGQLLNSLDVDMSHIRFGEVEYINYEEDTVPITSISSVYHKRKSFDHEDEFRLTIRHTGDDLPDEFTHKDSGTIVQANLSEMIHEIYLSPTSEKWFKDLVRKVIDTYNIDCEIKRSELYNREVFTNEVMGLNSHAND